MADIKDDSYWKDKLTPEQYRILRQKGTDRPFTGAYYHEKTPGIYCCAACGEELFESRTKYDSGSGWPSFYDVIGAGKVELTEDRSHGMERVEVTCKKCGGHLGHLFDDGPAPTGQRYCINSTSLKLKPVSGGGGRK